MTRYELAKLVQWAGHLRSRKRLQKVVYLLQSADCPVEAEFFLHHYGPYSQDVARLADEMVQAGLLAEQAGANGVGKQYAYHLSPAAAAAVAATEATPQGQEWRARMEPFAGLADRLLKTDLSDLEYGATVAYFRRQGCDWPAALARACEFKKLSPDSPAAAAALALARTVIS